MKRSNFALRLPDSLMKELKKTAAMEGVAVNQFISLAVAEKLAVWRTEDFFRQRAKRANLTEAFEILSRVGDNPPIPGDELPEGWPEPVGFAPSTLSKSSRRSAVRSPRTPARKRK